MTGEAAAGGGDAPTSRSGPAAPGAEGDAAAYARLLAAQVTGLLATGVAVVALGLVAFELVGEDAGAVLGTALALKMAVAVLAAPPAAALAARLPQRGWLVGLCLARAGALCVLPFVSEVWHLYALVVGFQAASTAYTAAYLGLTPELLPDPDAYARALAKGRVAYEVETLASPLVAAALLSALEPRAVFVAAAVAFLAAAVLSAGVAEPPRAARRPAMTETPLWRLGKAPELRAALLLGFAGAVVTAMAAVNTVALVRGPLGRPPEDAALALAAFGAGAVAGALLMPRLIADRAERAVMLGAALAMAGMLAAGAWITTFAGLALLWVGVGAAATLTQAPFAALLRRRAPPGQRLAAYAAHHALGQIQLLVSYLAAGWVGAQAGMTAAFLGLATFAALASLAGAAIWPRPKEG